MENAPSNPLERHEEMRKKYPHAFGAAYLQSWARGRNELPEFEAYIKGDGSSRGEVTIVKHNGQLMVRWDGNNYALLPDGGERDPIYVDAPTMQILDLDPNMAINAREERRTDEVPLELQVVRAHRKYEDALKGFKKDVGRLSELEFEWRSLRAQLFPHEEAEFLREQRRTAEAALRAANTQEVPEDRSSTSGERPAFGSQPPPPEKSSPRASERPPAPDEDVAETA